MLRPLEALFKKVSRGHVIITTYETVVGGLIVDESLVVRVAISRMLNKQGILSRMISEAPSGKEAFELFELTKPDLVFMDLDMPSIDSAEVSAKRMELNLEVKVVLLTGLGLEDPRVLSTVNNGAFDVIKKPFQETEIRRSIMLVSQNESVFD
jgi:chemotaxis response regulator CheB